uniref:Uncharacterized protein n=1 Tax=Romanomermis culicivorax TaxID=13658 RepID=A0A915IFY9_ROMCU
MLSEQAARRAWWALVHISRASKVLAISIRKNYQMMENLNLLNLLMTRNHKRKLGARKYMDYPDRKVDDAIKACKGGMSAREVAETVPKYQKKRKLMYTAYINKAIWGSIQRKITSMKLLNKMQNCTTGNVDFEDSEPKVVNAGLLCQLAQMSVHKQKRRKK